MDVKYVERFVNCTVLLITCQTVHDKIKSEPQIPVFGQDTAKRRYGAGRLLLHLNLCLVSPLGREAQSVLVSTSILQSWSKVSFEGWLRRLYCARVSKCNLYRYSSNRKLVYLLAKKAQPVQNTMTNKSDAQQKSPRLALVIIKSQ